MFGVSKYIIGALLIMLLMVTGVSYFYFKYSQKEIATLQQNNAKLTLAVEEQKKTIEAIQKDLMAQKIIAKNLETSYTTSRLEVDSARRRYNELAKRMGQASFGNYAANKPIDLQQIINQDSNKLFLCFQIVSGRTREELHLNDADFKQLQSFCPM